MSQRIKSVSTGYVKGFPDIFIYEPRGTYHGLAIEIKTLKGRPTKEQKQWIDDLNERCYRASIKKGWDEIIKEIDFYFSLPYYYITNEKGKQQTKKNK